MIDERKMTYETLSHEAIVRALLENYESIYVVDVGISAFQCFHESDSYSSLKLESQGDDFFKTMEININNTIYFEDRDFVRAMMSKNSLKAALDNSKFYSFVYRLVIDGKPLYHKLRATMDIVEGRPHFLIGVRNVDAAFRQDKALAERLSSMHSKEINHLEAILASAEGYLEVNLSNDSILDISPYKSPKLLPESVLDAAKNGKISYTEFINWHTENRVVVNRDKLIKISDRNYLTRCFQQNEKRASASFSMKDDDAQIIPCKIVFYLYKEPSSGDILSFCVLYDLTDQQRKEKELKELENELQRIRLRNFTSQMQPHFLYNTLGSIQEIVLEDPLYASELIGDFSIHLRSCIRAMANDQPIPFEQELANVKAYVNIERMRFGDKLKVCFDIETEGFNILPLTIQPIVENAIRHGIYERGKKGGTVWVKTAESENNIRITVEDDGIGFDLEEYYKRVTMGGGDSTGLKNIMFRLDKMMNASVDVESHIGSGTKVTIMIPKESKMRAIIVDDEPLMLKRFARLSADIEELSIVGQFESANEALSFAKDNAFEAAFLDVAMPGTNGIELAKELRNIHPDVIIVFVSAYDEYIWDFNQIGGDYYILKPYNKETIEMTMKKLRLLMQRQHKELFIQTFGRFLVLRNGKPIKLSGKAKEILALIVTRRGKEISNEEIYCTVWENRPYGNIEMTVYYNAIRRLKQSLKDENIEDLLISTKRGQLVNTAMFDCDYYDWQDKNMGSRDRFEGEFMAEYSWGENILAGILDEMK